MRHVLFSAGGSSRRLALSLFIAAPGAPHAMAAAEPGKLEEIVVTARLVPKPVDTVPASISVLPAALIRERQANHFEELLNAAPNVNYSSGASRGRFVQIRGIGERSQFVDPVDPSVGLYIDGIDFSGLGNAGTLFRRRAGRGAARPAGHGLRCQRDGRPGQYPLRGAFRQGDGTGGRRGVGIRRQHARRSGERLAGARPRRAARAAPQPQRRLHRERLPRRDDTNAIDETTARARLDWQASDALALGLT